MALRDALGVLGVLNAETRKAAREEEQKKNTPNQGIFPLPRHLPPHPLRLPGYFQTDPRRDFTGPS